MHIINPYSDWNTLLSRIHVKILLEIRKLLSQGKTSFFLWKKPGSRDQIFNSCGKQQSREIIALFPSVHYEFFYKRVTRSVILVNKLPFLFPSSSRGFSPKSFEAKSEVINVELSIARGKE